MKNILVVVGGCGDTNGKPRINETRHLNDAYEFGKNIWNEV